MGDWGMWWVLGFGFYPITQILQHPNTRLSLFPTLFPSKTLRFLGALCGEKEVKKDDLN
jgi:hypothetical protein